MLKVSFVTPTYNSAKSIKNNVDSILSQTYQNFEHVIIDNASSDSTRDIIKDAYSQTQKTAKLRIISEKDKGISDAFNKGVSAANGDVIAILNSDDCYHEAQIVEKIMAVFEAIPDVDFVHGDMLFIDPHFGTNLRKPLECDLEYAMPYNHPTMFVRRRVYETIGHFNLQYRYCMDFDLVCRMMINNCKGFYLPETITRMYSGGASDTNEMKALNEFQKILESHGRLTAKARKWYKQKRLRITLKQSLNTMHLNGLIRLWRNNKWN